MNNSIGMTYLKGDVVYIENASNTCGDFNTGKPVLVVSSDDINTSSDYITVAKIVPEVSDRVAPYSAKILCKTESYAILSNIRSVHKSKIIDYGRSCTSDELKRIDRALANAFSLSENTPQKQPKEPTEVVQKPVDKTPVQTAFSASDRRIIELETELRVYKDLYRDAIQRR